MGILHGHALQIARRLHGPSSVIWLVLIGVHVLVYLKRALTNSREDLRPTTRRDVQGSTWRTYTLAAALMSDSSLVAATFLPNIAGSACTTTMITATTTR